MSSSKKCSYGELKFKYLKIALVMFKCLFGFLIIYLFLDFLYNNTFLVDAERIYDLYINLTPGSLLQFSLTDSYTNTARLYRLILFNAELSFNHLLILTSLLYLFLFWILINNIQVKHHKYLFIGFMFIFIFDMIFLFMPSKDYFSLIINLLLLLAIKNDSIRQKIFTVLIFALYGLFFRNYYLLIGAVFIYLLFLQKSNKKLFWLLLSFFFIVCLHYFSNYLDTIFSLRYALGKYLIENSNTIILDIFPYDPTENNLLLFLINYLINFLRILFPVEVFFKSLSRGLVFVPLQLGINLFILQMIWKLFKEKITCINRSENKTVKQVLLYLISFTAVSVLFEPDFGSVFRHNMNLLPFYLYLLFEVELYTEPLGSKTSNLIQLNPLV